MVDYVFFFYDIILWAHCYEHKVWVTNYLFFLMIWYICVANYVLFLDDVQVREVKLTFFFIMLGFGW
jgi:hypothetical protein